MDVSRFLIVLGLAIVIAGLLWPFLAKTGIGRLPGDIMIERENFTLYIPLMSGLLISVVFSALLWLLAR